jgi:hypothetical protein
MPKRLWPCIVLLSLSAIAKEADPYVETLWNKNYLKASNGDEIILAHLESYGGKPNHQRLFLRRNKKVLWDKTFSQEYGALWNSAYFIPLTPDQFLVDLNNDGFNEFAVATSHGGQAVWSNLAIIFSLKDDEIEYLKTFPINVEFSRSVYSQKLDYLNLSYKCQHCN